MMKNWYQLPIEELETRKRKLTNWVMEFPKNEKAKQAWQAIMEITEVLEVKKTAQKDGFVQLLIDTLCI